MVKTGSNAVIGSWNTMAADLPRIADSVRRLARRTSTLSSFMDSAETLAVAPSNRMQREESHRLAGSGLADNPEAFAFVDMQS